MIPLDQARTNLLNALQPLGTETVPLDKALHRVAARPVTAQLDVPAFDNASVDGYALRTKDLLSLPTDKPFRLRIHTTIAAGDPPIPHLPHATAARIFTGAPIPPDANVVVMQEETVREPDDHVTLLAPVTPWEGVRFAGEDVRRGSTLVPAGQRLHPAHLGLLAAAGVASVSVHQRPRISLLTSGDELVEPSPNLPPGKLPDSNRYLLAALAHAAGAQILGLHHLPDHAETIQTTLRDAAAASDVVVTTGGVSVGDADLLKDACAALGGRIEFWRVAMKPGKPFAFGRLANAHWFGLPGNPVSAFVTWQLLVRPALRKLEGEQEVFGRRIAARLAEPLANSSDRTHVLRVRLDSNGVVRPTGTQASHIQSGLASANALLEVPPGTDWPSSHQVEVELID